ncbi:hypothetical protein P154DRAFT_526732 [Amniculicola lignicola CBS 123094]|uniref:Uncharacterized protein n=1 Tax=Amniculicola lignicola CBS 123094 TaxID=1392246 RepID=A0A6A5VZR8_9PLEO|nr:hypothetical protein P154DRAFT_526732 [Amniculicola lignicola CBS 123094]
MAAPSNRPVRVTTTEATALINPTTRNDVYSNLVSNGGIRAIESSWEQTLQSIGWFDRFEAYTRHLLRTGEATTMDQVWAKVDAKIKESPALSRTNGANGVNGHSNSNGNSNGNGSGNGTLTDSDTDEFDLRIPDDTLKAMVKATRGELDKFVQVTWDEDLSSTPATTDK